MRGGAVLAHIPRRGIRHQGSGQANAERKAEYNHSNKCTHATREPCNDIPNTLGSPQENAAQGGHNDFHDGPPYIASNGNLFRIPIPKETIAATTNARVRKNTSARHSPCQINSPYLTHP